MITIKIKTFPDYKKMFLDWVKEPRRKRCKEFVDYMSYEIEAELDRAFEEDLFLKNLNVDHNTLYMKVLMVVHRVQLDTKDFIDETQPKGITDTL